MKTIVVIAYLALSALASPLAGSASLKDKYIVVLKDTYTPLSVLKALGIPLRSAKRFEHVLNGFAGTFDAATISTLSRHDAVSYIEHDAEINMKVTQSPATYNLAICSEQSKLAASQQNVYYYKAGGGLGAKAYIIDSGIYIAHSDFGGRAINGYNDAGGDFSDGNGHGTHVAGIIGGTTYGIAKNVTLVSVKILDSSGATSTSKVIDGINWSVNDCNGGRCVINLSVGGAKSSALNSAVDAAYNKGLLSVVAAGNDNTDACQYSPASATTAFVVSNIGADYSRTSSANIGSCVDIFAPGQNVKSDWIGSPTATNILSGTSIAAPHVAGVAAYFLSFQARTPADLVSFILSKAQKGLIPNAGANSPNLIVNNGWFFGVQ